MADDQGRWWARIRLGLRRPSVVLIAVVGAASTVAVVEWLEVHHWPGVVGLLAVGGAARSAAGVRMRHLDRRRPAEAIGTLRGPRVTPEDVPLPTARSFRAWRRVELLAGLFFALLGVVAVWAGWAGWAGLPNEPDAAASSVLRVVSVVMGVALLGLPLVVRAELRRASVDAPSILQGTAPRSRATVVRRDGGLLEVHTPDGDVRRVGLGFTSSTWTSRYVGDVVVVDGVAEPKRVVAITTQDRVFWMQLSRSWSEPSPGPSL